MCGSTTGRLGLLGLYINEYNVALITQTLETLTEYCQGPCHENQVTPFLLWVKTKQNKVLLVVSGVRQTAGFDSRSQNTQMLGRASEQGKVWETSEGQLHIIWITQCMCLQSCIVTHESNGIDIITALILNDISPLCKYRMDLVLQLKVEGPARKGGGVGEKE